MIRPLFKVHEPFMEVPKGYGFLGVVMYDDKKDRVQCHICRKWVRMLAQHARMAHGLHSEDYRNKFSLPIRGGLTCNSTSTKKSALGMSNENIKRLSSMRARLSKRRTTSQEQQRLSSLRSRRCASAHGRLASKNRIGLCSAQMAARFDVVRRIVGRNPSNLDLMTYDKKLYEAMRRAGGPDQWRKTHGIPLFPKKKQAIYKSIDIIAALRKSGHQLGHSPSITWWNNANIKPSSATIRRVFGSWRTALTMAGLA